MMIKQTLLILVFSGIFSQLYCQNKPINYQYIDDLVEQKKQMVNNYEIKSFYTLQLFSGKRENAVEAKNEYDQKNFDYKSIIEYETPNYKVWVGRFRTKFYADKAFEELKKNYPNALILKPGR